MWPFFTVHVGKYTVRPMGILWALAILDLLQPGNRGGGVALDLRPKGWENPGVKSPFAMNFFSNKYGC